MRVMRLLVLVSLCHPALALICAHPEAVIDGEEGEKDVEETHPLRGPQTEAPMAGPIAGGVFIMPHTHTRFSGAVPRSLARVMGPRSLPALAGALLAAGRASWWMGST